MGMKSRKKKAHKKQKPTHVPPLSKVEVTYYEEKIHHIGNRTLLLFTLMVIVGPYASGARWLAEAVYLN